MGRPKMTEREFWSKVDRNGPVPKHRPELGPCWIWVMAKSEKGYGVTSYDHKFTTAHRLSWFFTNGRIDSSEMVCHHCDTPPCCNPAHLFLGNHKSNAEDMVSKSRQSRGESHAQAILPNRPRGEENALHKFTEAQVLEMRRLYAETKTPIQEIADLFNASYGGTEKIVRGISWAQLEGSKRFKRGERLAKHPPERVAEIRRLRAEGMKIKAIAAHFSMSIFTINDIVYHRTHKE